MPSVLIKVYKAISSLIMMLYMDLYYRATNRIFIPVFLHYLNINTKDVCKHYKEMFVPFKPDFIKFKKSSKVCVCVIYIHTHTHTHTYIRLNDVIHTFFFGFKTI